MKLKLFLTSIFILLIGSCSRGHHKNLVDLKLNIPKPSNNVKLNKQLLTVTDPTIVSDVNCVAIFLSDDYTTNTNTCFTTNNEYIDFSKKSALTYSTNNIAEIEISDVPVDSFATAYVIGLTVSDSSYCEGITDYSSLEVGSTNVSKPYLLGTSSFFVSNDDEITIDLFGTESISHNQIDTSSCIFSESSSSVSYSSLVLSKNPHFYYKFDGDFLDSSGNAIDLVGNNNASSLGTSAISEGGTSASLDGVNDYISNGAAEDNFDLGSGQAFTIEFWLSSTDTNAYIFDKYTGSTGYYGKINATGHFYVNFGGVDLTSTSPINDGSFRHIVITLDGSNNASGLKVYINGSLDVFGSTGSIINMDNANSFYIGTDYNQSAGAFANALIDEFAVYASELSASEIASHYSAGL